ncbi:hypothetical protein FRC16_006552 [Serendipita sp. 398]|nr:hypothetical protein FRC16_006552 [Serendipita sp. 398]
MEAEKTLDPPIFRLPVEILQYVFRQVVEMPQPIRDIRLTCRYWRDLVALDHTLPRTISVENGRYCVSPHHASTYRWDHCVHSAIQLITALQCIQSARVCLYLQSNIPTSKENWDHVPWDQLSGQCSKLFISKLIRPDAYPAFANILGRFPPLLALQYLSSHDNDIIFPSSLPIRKQPISINMPNLRSLSWSLQRDPAFDIENFRPIFMELTSFTLTLSELVISVDFLVGLFSSFQRLKDLSWDARFHNSNLVASMRRKVDWNFKLRKLSTNIELLAIFPPPVLHELTVLRGFRNGSFLGSTEVALNGSEGNLLHLPQLTELTLEDSWSKLLWIKAPSLQRLHLLSYYGVSHYVKRMEFTPLFIDIYDGGDGEVIEAFFGRAPLPNLVELHLNVWTCWAYTNDRLVELLSIDIGKKSSSLFPRLRSLVVRLLKYAPKGSQLLHIVRRDNVKREISAALSSLPYFVSVLE